MRGFTYVHSCGLMYVSVCLGLADKLHPLLKILGLSIVRATACSKYFVSYVVFPTRR